MRLASHCQIATVRKSPPYMQPRKNMNAPTISTEPFAVSRNHVQLNESIARVMWPTLARPTVRVNPHTEET